MRIWTVVFVFFAKFCVCYGSNSISSDNFSDPVFHPTFDLEFDVESIKTMFNNCTDIEGPCFHFNEIDNRWKKFLTYFRLIETLYRYEEQYAYVISIVGIFGNLIICITIIRNAKLQISPNYYIFNLAVADILSLPLHNLHQAFNLTGWILKTVITLNWTCNAVNIWSTVGIACDRYIAVCFPFKSRSICTQSRAIKLNFSIWICSLLHSTIMLIQRDTEVRPEILRDFFHIVFSIDMLAICFFMIPLTIISCSYLCIAICICQSAKLRKKSYAMEHTTKGLNLSVSVVLQFVICWGTFYTFLILMKHFSLQIGVVGGLMFFYFTKMINLLFKIIDPLIYSCVSRQFRNAFKETLWPRCVTNGHKVQGS